jgi:hypothetical protein
MGLLNDILSQSPTTQPKVLITAPPASGPDSGIVPANLSNTIVAKSRGPYATDGGVCVDPTPDSFDFQWITATWTGLNPEAMLSDYFVQLARPVRKIFLVGVAGPGVPAVFLHLVPLNKYNGTETAAASVFGNEPWIPFPGGSELRSQGAFGVGTGEALTDASFIRFCKPISKFFLTAWSPDGGANPYSITLLCTDDLDNQYTNTGL